MHFRGYKKPSGEYTLHLQDSHSRNGKGEGGCVGVSLLDAMQFVK
jgi:hypothetical protein